MIESSGSEVDDGFGYSISMSGDWLAVGAPFGHNYVGGVYLFRWNGSSYVEAGRVVCADSGQDAFGKAVSLDQDRLLVGVSTPWGDAAYVFHYDGWGETPWGDRRVPADDKRRPRNRASV